MGYATLIFLCFLMLTMIVYFSVPKKLQWPVLLLVSVLFYIISCGTKCILLLIATVVIYVAGLYIGRKETPVHRKKMAIILAIAALVTMLVAAKYFNFLGGVFNAISSMFGSGLSIPTVKLLLPLGISYYTLMAISYIADVYRKTSSCERNPFMLLLYLSYFPHIVEGPFDRYGKLSEQFRKPVYWDQERIRRGGVRFAWGAFKKLVIADRAGMIVNAIFADQGAYGGCAYLLAAILYTFQIYAEFSGCMDMVCGVSKIFGVDIAENFRRPFFSASINEFWRRWHITLGEWLKDYVFFTVSLSNHFMKLNAIVRKHVKFSHLVMFLPTAYALFFVWFFNGLWHGASVKYICYGLYYYCLMMAGLMLKPASDKAMGALKISQAGKGMHVFRVLRTCVIVVFGMLIFRSENLSQAWHMFVGIITDFHISELVGNHMAFKGVDAADYVVLVLTFVLMLTVSLLQEKNIDVFDKLEKQVLPIRWIVYWCLIFAVIIFGVYGGNATNTSFIYGEF